MRNTCCVAVIAMLVSPLTAASPAIPGDGPLMRAAWASLEAEQLKSPAPRSGKSRTDWSPVTRLRPGSEIILTVKGALAATPRLLFADGNGLIVLDVSHTRLPSEVRRTLVDTAKDHPLTLLAARSGEQLLPRRVRATPAGVFQGEQRLADLSEIVKAVPRSEVVDVRVRRKHIGTHSLRGALIGAAAGAALAAGSAGSCSECTAGGLAVAGALGGAVVGLEIGTIVGIVAPRSPDVIYHVD